MVRLRTYRPWRLVDKGGFLRLRYYSTVASPIFVCVVAVAGCGCSPRVKMIRLNACSLQRPRPEYETPLVFMHKRKDTKRPGQRANTVAQQPHLPSRQRLRLIPYVRSRVACWCCCCCYTAMINSGRKNNTLPNTSFVNSTLQRPPAALPALVVPRCAVPRGKGRQPPRRVRVAAGRPPLSRRERQRPSR